MTGQVIDFDAFRREKAAQGGTPAPILFRVGGKEYPIPSEPPAAVALDIIRMKRTVDQAQAEADAARAAGLPAAETATKTGMASLESLMGIGEAIFGLEAFAEILRENRIGSVELGELITKAFDAWPASEGDAAPNPRTPEQLTPST